MESEIKTASFVTSLTSLSNFNLPPLPEVAFIGRSNVGKSSLLNLLTRNGKLAKTSSTPGRTRLLNYFNINNSFYFVDLPGYGYHQASKSDEKLWVDSIQDFFENSKLLKLCVLLIDCNIEPTTHDLLMMKYLYYYQIPFIVVATKADKLSRAQLTKQIDLLSNKLALTKNNIYISKQNDQTCRSIIIKRIFEFLTI